MLLVAEFQYALLGARYPRPEATGDEALEPYRSWYKGLVVKASSE